MNTFENVRPIDLYEEDRREVYNDSTQSDEVFNELVASLEDTDPLAQQGQEIVGPSQIQPEPGDIPISQGLTEVPKESGMLDTALETVGFLASPLMAIGDAALAPLAHDYKTEGFVDNTGEAFKVSGAALVNSLFPDFGAEREFSGRMAVEKIIPEASDSVKDVIGTTLELVTDPTISVGLPMVKTIQRGLQVARNTAAAKGEVDAFKGIFTEGLHELFTVGKGYDPAELGDIGLLAKKADAGDKDAFAQLDAALTEVPAAREAVQVADDLDVENFVTEINKTLGDPNAPVFKVDGSAVPEDMLEASIQGNDINKAANINLSRLNTSEDVDNLLVKVGEKYAEDFNQIMGKQSNSETAKISQNQQLMDLIGKKSSEFDAPQAYALRQTLVASGNQLLVLAKRAELTGSKLDTLAFDKGLAVHRTIQNKVSGVTSEAGRLLQQFNMSAGTGRGRVKQVNDIIVNLGESGTTKKVMRKLLAASEDATQVNRIIGKSPWIKTADAAFEVFTNSILSGPLTHMINMTSNAFTVALSPTESMLEGMSAATRADFQNMRINFGDAAAKLNGVVQGIGDAARLVFSSKNMDEIGAPEELSRMHELAKQKFNPSISSEALGVSGKAGAAVDFLGNMIRVPGNALLEEDKAFKLIHYRMETNSQAYKKASSVDGSSADIRAVYNLYKNNPDEHMIANAIDKASYYTFTSELGDTAASVHKTFQKVPGLRYLVPFFKTPTNIVKMGLRSSPFGNIYQDLTPALTDWTAKGDIARAKIAAGTMIPAAVMSYLSDNITGHIDQKTPTGRFKAQSGIPPYSIKMGDTWVSYEKIEPLRSILGLFVNYKEAIDNVADYEAPMGEVADPLPEQLFVALTSPVIQTVGDNYMLPFFGDMMYMLEGVASGNGAYAMKRFKKLVASAMVPNFLRQVNNEMLDGTYRKADTFIDMLKQGIPGLSQTLPARKTIWGDDVVVKDGIGPDMLSPIKTASVEMDDVDRELIQLGVRIPGQPKGISVRGTTIVLELSPEQQEEFSVIRGKGFPDSPGLKEVMAEMAKDEMFAMQPDDARRDTYENMFTKATEATKRYMMATDELLKEQLKTRMEALERRLQQQQ